MRVSVVICTLNRADALGSTLRCLQHQHHSDFEVIVVNGPSTDHTCEVLAPWREHVRYYENPKRNLSISRNIGIRHSVGELVAFIDDDALPEPDWLMQAIPAFDDLEVAAAGGIVFDHTGMTLQYRYALTDRLLRTRTSDHDSSLMCFPGTFNFPYLQGTNQIHRRGPLLGIGGFDENIYFYGDDCDVCCRLIDAGYVVRQLPDSPVHHKYLPSGIRDHQRITTDWFPVVHDYTYFGLRHGSAYLSEDEILHHVHEFIHTRIADTQLHEAAGRLPAGSSTYAEATCLRAFAEGLRDGQSAVSTPLPELVVADVEFLPFPTLRNERRRKLTFVSSSYSGNITGGIGRLFADLAPAMAARGHDVRVITRATASPAVDFEEGVWVHRVDTPLLPAGDGVVPDVLAPINAFATAAAEEVNRIRGWTEPDLVFAPLWDVEAIAALRETDLPVGVHVSTPLAVIGPMAGYLRGDHTDPPELRRLAEVEAEVLDTADLLQANTHAVMGTIRSRSGGGCADERWSVVNIGVKDQAPPRTSSIAAPSRRRSVLFVGRLEVRKGIDTLLAAMVPILRDREDVELVLAGEDRPLGPGQPPIAAHWLTQHADEPWVDRVRVLGVVDDTTLHREYAMAEVVALPSRYESFGLVMVEAMMHGKPLVSTDTSGVREVVRQGVDGLLVPPGNVDELGRAIRTMLDDRRLAASLGAAARARFESHLSIERVAERFERLLVRLSTLSDGPTELSAGEATVIDLRGRAAAMIVLTAAESARVYGAGGAGEAIDLTRGQRCRVRLDVGGEAKIGVEHGRVVVERVVVVDRRSAVT